MMSMMMIAMLVGDTVRLTIINIAQFRPQDKSSNLIRPQILLNRGSSGPNSLEVTVCRPF